jgi:hypothetical protein
MNALLAFFGRSHPVLVHLPIGFLLLALVFQWLARKEKYRDLLPAVRISFIGNDQRGARMFIGTDAIIRWRIR